MLHGREHRRWEMRCSERLRLIGHIITLYGEARKRRTVQYNWFVGLFLNKNITQAKEFCISVACVFPLSTRSAGEGSRW